VPPQSPAGAIPKLESRGTVGQQFPLDWNTPSLVETRFSPDALVWVTVVVHGTARHRPGSLGPDPQRVTDCVRLGPGRELPGIPVLRRPGARPDLAPIAHLRYPGLRLGLSTWQILGARSLQNNLICARPQTSHARAGAEHIGGSVRVAGIERQSHCLCRSGKPLGFRRLCAAGSAPARSAAARGLPGSGLAACVSR
jgi:hypothetical protein